MTGFAQGELEDKKSRIYIKAKSVNSRYLDTKVNLSSNLFELEPELRDLVSQFISRGSVEVTVHCLDKDMGKRLKSLKSWTKNYKKLSKELEVIEDLTLDMVIKESSQTGHNKAEKEVLKSVLKVAEAVLMDLKKERTKEGKELKKVLLAELLKSKKSFDAIKKLVSADRENITHRFNEKLKALNIEINKERFESEVALLLDKSDVTEEFDRLEVHFKEFKSLINSKDSVVGKKLDFYCQELSREVNTVGSKIKNSTVTKSLVDLKSSIETIRQQVQNIQ